MRGSLPDFGSEVAVLPLPPTVRQKLQAAGFRTVGDLRGVNPVALSKEADLAHDDALAVLTAVRGEDGQAAAAGARSAAAILREERARRSIATGGAELDGLLGGGVAPQEVTEFCGVPGIGKTQLGMQLTVSVQIPEALGGLAGHAIYIDTEGSLIAERLVDMAEAALRDMRARAAASCDATQQAEVAGLSVEQMLASVHYFRVHSATEQRALLHSLETFLQKHPRVRLVVIDSIAFHYRQDFDDTSQRTRILNEAALLLMKLAEQFSLAVVTINQVTTKVATDGPSTLVPALGESFAHTCTTRVILFWQQDLAAQRCAHLYKSPRLAQATVPYSVQREGIRSKDGSCSFGPGPAGAAAITGHKRPHLDT